MRHFGVIAILALAMLLGARPAVAAPQAQATLSASSVEMGAGVTLVVAITDPSGATGKMMSRPRRAADGVG